MASIESTGGPGVLCMSERMTLRVCVCVWRVYMCSADPISVYVLREESLEQRGGEGVVTCSEDMRTLYNDPQFMLRGF